MSLRTEVTTVVQKILAVYKASNCFVYCAQRYCEHVVQNVSDSQALPNIIHEIITTEGVHIEAHDDEDSGKSQGITYFGKQL